MTRCIYPWEGSATFHAVVEMISTHIAIHRRCLHAISDASYSSSGVGSYPFYVFHKNFRFAWQSPIVFLDDRLRSIQKSGSSRIVA
jgi:hypothetical protein